MHKDPPYSNIATYMYAYKSRIMYGSQKFTFYMYMIV